MASWTGWGKRQIGIRNAGEGNPSKYDLSSHPWRVLGPPVNFAEKLICAKLCGQEGGRKIRHRFHLREPRSRWGSYCVSAGNSNRGHNVVIAPTEIWTEMVCREGRWLIWGNTAYTHLFFTLELIAVDQWLQGSSSGSSPLLAWSSPQPWGWVTQYPSSLTFKLWYLTPKDCGTMSRKKECFNPY